MFSFTTYPFCRSAKDYLDVKDITHETMELDELDGNNGNRVRASSGKITGRTSVPSIFICGIPSSRLNNQVLSDNEELNVIHSTK